MTLPAALEHARTGGARVLVLSPHLDDAVLSCGALLGSLDRCEITVLTLFTACSPGPHTRAARSFLRQCAHPDADALFAARRDEDREVVNRLGAHPEHAGHADALFRRREVPALVGRVLPELAHRYPTYRFDIAKGRTSRGDRPIRDALGADLSARAGGIDLLLAPLGVGRHVDHLISRDLGAGFAGDVVHYSDFPYSLTQEPDPAFVRRAGLRPHRFDDRPEEKEALIRGYRTQVDALFPDGTVPRAAETYWAASSATSST